MLGGVREKRVGRTRAQAADVLLDEAGVEADDEEEADDDALAFVSEPDEPDEESDDFEDDDAGVLLDEEPRLSFR